MQKLSDYINANTDPFFTADFMAKSYAPFNDTEFSDMLVNWCNFNHGSLQIRPLLEDAEKKDADIIRKRVSNLLLVRKYQYNKLYESTLLKYEPIENYAMIEEGTDVHTINARHTDSIGNQTNTSSVNDSTTIGAQTMSNNGTNRDTLGNQQNHTTTETTESGNVVNEKKVAPFDSDTYAEQEQNTEIFNGRTTAVDSTTRIDEVVNQHTTESESTNSERKDSKTSNINEAIGSREDSHTDTSTDTMNHNFTRHGNIGVTTSQQMLESEREVAMFNFIGIVAHDIIKSICICLY